MAINRGKQYTEVNSDSNRMLHLYYNDQYLDNQLRTKKKTAHYWTASLRKVNMRELIMTVEGRLTPSFIYTLIKPKSVGYFKEIF